MQRFLRWLETRFSRHSAVVEADERHMPVGGRVRPTKGAQESVGEKGLKSYNSTESGRFLQLTPEAVCDRARRGELVAYKPGRAWVFLEEDLIRYLQTTRPETVLKPLHALPRSATPAQPVAIEANATWIDLYRLARAKGL